MVWLYLLLAGMIEMGWPLGLKYAWTDKGVQIAPAAVAIACILLSGFLLFLAQREIPVGTAYAIWTGLGTVGTFALGIVLFGEPAQALRFVFVGLILAGIIGLKLVST
ncbi:MAG: multidrug efflux SMR transporter [Candidatus Dadabacteria bacterium]|nr:multidrug efflux SMR transporter [Candidatus Dadabacteria bacterium]